MTVKSDPSADTWIVVADGVGARLFEEPRRNGALHLLHDLKAPMEERRPLRPRGTVFERAGGGRHGVPEGSPTDIAEEKFLHEVADTLRKAAAAGRYHHLVLIAPPKALGELRSFLGEDAERIELSDHHDRVDDSLEEIRARVHELRGVT